MDKSIVVAVKGVVVRDGRMLIVKRSSDDETGGGTWECTGGKLDFGETLQFALAREIVEETGLEVAVGELLFATTILTSPVRQVAILTYLCRAESDAVLLSAEHSDFCWADKDEVKAMLAPDIISDFEKHGVFERAEIWEGVGNLSSIIH
ncbi:NUDIX hydrolase [Bacillus sp. FJAT-27245]|uniref:NUDIX hydrolase n=1 Tax=Bacillus sp. FJAT-27245 TaxID=1684144 RepID=UPI0006A75D74|nr:NUDIX domain-containing protein [Bacillus sp. FJAT-27245]